MLITRKKGFSISNRMRQRGTNPARWAREKGHSHRTVNEVLYSGMGGKRGGPKTAAIIADLVKDGYIREPQKAASNDN